MVEGGLTKTGDLSPVDLVDDGRCFGCGTENPIGLRLQFVEDGDGVRANFVAPPELQGYAGLLHGGLAATVLDEAAAWAISKRLGPAVTAEFHMRHRHPVPIGEQLELRARVVKRRLSMVETEAEIIDCAGRVLVDAQVKFMLVKSSDEVA